MDVETLVAIEEIKRLKYRYLRCLDLKKWDELAECLTEDVTATYSGGGYSFDGRDSVMEFLVTSMASTSMLTSHTCHHPEIDVADGEATGTWSLFDRVLHQEFDVMIEGSAFYEDRYVHRDGRWWIAHTGYRRVFEEITPISATEGRRLTASWWATDGRSELAG